MLVKVLTSLSLRKEKGDAEVDGFSSSSSFIGSLPLTNTLTNFKYFIFFFHDNSFYISI